MEQKPVTPGQLIWKRLMKNSVAVTGLAIIFLASIVAVFCYILMPDNSPDANEMNLALATRKPGFHVTVLRQPLITQIEEKSLLSSMFSGVETGFKSIAVDTFWIRHDTIYYMEFSGDDFEKMPLVKKSINEFYFGNKPGK